MIFRAVTLKFKQNGLVAIPGFFTDEEVDEMLQQSHTLIKACKDSNVAKTRFSTLQDDQHASNDYFLESAKNISYFYEEGADGKESDMLNKIGHNLHELDGVFKKYSFCEKVDNLKKQLGFIEPVVLQSMIILKHAKVGGTVKVHRDSTFLYTKPMSAIGFWIALEDATVDNGCLWYLPGSHNIDDVKRRFVRNPDYFQDSKLRTPKNPEDRKGVAAVKFRYEDGYEAALEENGSSRDYVSAEVKKGTLVLIHGSVLHKSELNTSDKSRFAYTFHVIEGTADYSDENWIPL
jgi:hypothetical protein